MNTHHKQDAMPHRHESMSTIQDTIIAGSLVAAPAWASWVSELNEMLTTMTLVVGLVIGGARLWFLVADRRRPPRP